MSVTGTTPDMGEGCVVWLATATGWDMSVSVVGLRCGLCFARYAAYPYRKRRGEITLAMDLLCELIADVVPPLAVMAGACAGDIDCLLQRGPMHQSEASTPSAYLAKNLGQRRGVFQLQPPSRHHVSGSRRGGLGRVRVPTSTLSLQVRPAPHARREGVLFLSPSPAVDAAPHPGFTSISFLLPPSPPPRRPACGWFIPPSSSHPDPRQSPYRPPPAQFAFDSPRFIPTFLTTSFTSFDVHAFYNPLENFPPFVRGNAPGAKASQGPIT